MVVVSIVTGSGEKEESEIEAMRGSDDRGPGVMDWGGVDRSTVGVVGIH